MKNDYTYIALLDENTSGIIREIQAKLEEKLGISEYSYQWTPHITVSFGNLLDIEELDLIIKEINESISDIKSFAVKFDGVSFIKKEVQGSIYYSLRLKVAPNIDIDNLSEKIKNIASKYEVPFDAFSSDHFHLGLGRYNISEVDTDLVNNIISIEKLENAFVSSIAINYSMMNVPKPEKAKEVFNLKLK